MKRGTTPALEVRVGIDHDLISTIDFLFVQECSEACTTRLTKSYPSSAVTYANGVYTIKWTAAETRMFAENTNFYMDTKPVLGDGTIPETKIVALFMNRTLFTAVVEPATDTSEVTADD